MLKLIAFYFALADLMDRKANIIIMIQIKKSAILTNRAVDSSRLRYMATLRGSVPSCGPRVHFNSAAGVALY
jgi:hypothetical protein